METVIRTRQENVAECSRSTQKQKEKKRNERTEGILHHLHHFITISSQPVLPWSAGGWCERMKAKKRSRVEKSIYTRWCKLALCSILGKAYENPACSRFHMKPPQICFSWIQKSRTLLEWVTQPENTPPETWSSPSHPCRSTPRLKHVVCSV